MSATYELIAPCFFGCESTASFELRRLGAGDLRVTDGRLTFRGGADLIAAANLNLRTVERVLLLLASYKAETFDDLFDGVYAIPWEELLPADAAFPVKGSSLNSKLSSVDTSGEGLHKRGYRRNAMEAPLRETLAATIVDLGRVRRDSLVEDPFCGSGTLVIEAAQKALNIAPGLQRRFAAEHYSFVPPAVWAEQRRKALDEIKQDAAFEGFGYDIDPAAVELARANARLAGVDKRCHFEVADVKDFAPRPEAIVLTNPPYGERMSTIDGAARLAQTFGRQMEAHPCAGAYIITADMEFEAHYGRRAAKRRKMYNGMIPCQVYMYYSAPGAKAAKPMPALSKDGFDGRRGHPHAKNGFEKGGKGPRSDK